MGYQKALEAAGAEILAFGEFGSYQGDWWAKVRYEGNTGWICGSFGSCSYCDAFYAEFNYETHKCENDEYYDPINDGFREGCPECGAMKKKLIEFGKSYLTDLLSDSEALKEASRNLDWDLNAEDMVKFIKENTED